MNTVLICDAAPGGKGFFRPRVPAALVPVFGRISIDRALEQIHREGGTEVIVLASDRPHLVRAALASGSHWGMRVQVEAVEGVLSAEVARLRFADGFATAGDISVRRLSDSNGLSPAAGAEPGRDLFVRLLETGNPPGLVTMRQSEPGIWVSSRARVNASAELVAPVWIGPSVRVAAGAVVGPGTIVEAGALIEPEARLVAAWIGPDTYVGRGAELVEVEVWGNLIQARAGGGLLDVSDTFVLADLRNRGGATCGLLSRCCAALLLALTLPVVLPWMLWRAVRKRPILGHREVHLSGCGRGVPSVRMLRSLAGVPGLRSRWPELLEVLRGRMRLVGNRPLARRALAGLGAARRELWTRKPSGIFSLADAESIDGDRAGAAQSHAAWFTTHDHPGLRASIFFRCLFRALFPRSASFPKTRTQTIS